MKLRHRYTGVDYIEAAKYNVIFKDVFNLKYVYILAREWFIEEGYAPRADEEFPEVYYLQKENPVSGKELWIRWRLTKNPLPGKSKFWKFAFDVDIHVLTLTDVEILVKDKKIKAHKGEVEFQVWANLVWDATGEWEKSSWLKPFKKVYFQRVLREKREELKEQLYKEAYRFQGALKTYFKLESYLPEKEMEGVWSKRTGE